MRYNFGVILMTAALLMPVRADQQESEEILRARIILPVESLQRQSSYEILIEMQIGEDWHINSNQPLEEFLIPTEISFDARDGLSFGKISYMTPEMKKFAFSETMLSVYEGKAYAKTNITIPPDYPENEVVLRGRIYFQACNDQSCLAPDEITFTKLVEILPAGETEVAANTELFEQVGSRFTEEVAPQPAGDDSLADVLKSSGLVYSLIFIYLGGLALNLTPCVYPLIPITISYFGGQSQGSRGGLVMRALLYVLGMAVTYSILGVVAALTGGLLGSALQNPVVLIFVALVLVGLALSMFGLYEIRVPQSLALIGGKSRSGYLGTLFMGLTVGLIAAPCIGPFVLGLLTYVSDLGNPLLGFWMFFVLAMGLGTPFLVLGIFSGAASGLPRSGAWMVWVRNIFGFVLIGMAVYFLEPLFPSATVYFYVLALLAVIAGVYLGWIDKNKGGTPFRVVRNLVGVGFIALGVFFALPSGSAAGPQISWQKYTPEILEQAQDEGKPVIIDFYADWCIPCKELDKFTFTDPRVPELADQMVMVKADLTRFQDEQTTQLREKFSIKGVPTIVFLDKKGQEIESIRLTGFEDADAFVQRMRRLLDQTTL